MIKDIYKIQVVEKILVNEIKIIKQSTIQSTDDFIPRHAKYISTKVVLSQSWIL